MDIRISEISSYLKCPRMLYFMQNDYVFEPSDGYFSHILLKELAAVIPLALQSDDIYAYLDNEFRRIADELPQIYRAEIMENNALYNSVVQNIHDELPSITQLFIENIDGAKNLFKMTMLHENEVTLYSKHSGLRGNIDRIMDNDGALVPSLIKTSKAPMDGMWKNDRIQLAACAMLLEGCHDIVVTHGMVEYVRSGAYRFTVIKRQDRRTVLGIINKIRKIKEGRMPDVMEGAPCEWCSFIGVCKSSKVTLKSRFF